ncbi:glucan biosynthesis protein G [Rivibacter subsaxonicus]|uniref:Glucans biosynthesis protein G n=1 Tax=Rivibacter subsaxonicus TaxID=457575 RepID=A0A4Q7V7Z8_9BURK|nr:glucan biosynthesis protein G [Rivibacter subsaxonicus]RZT91443.1 glucans biosynthesis protein [Rivibacter subsaxonicus]
MLTQPLLPYPLLLRCLVAALLATPALCLAALPAAFDLDTLTQEARRLAAQPWQPPRAVGNARLAALSYDDYRDIRFKPAASLWRAEGLPFELQFFHAGRGNTLTPRLHEIVDGEVRPLALPRSAFSYGRAAAAINGAAGNAEVAGFRVHYPLNDPAYKDELAVFLGASYLRAIGAGQHYGLSARGIAVDTVGGAAGEEFPAFTAFWVERPARDARELAIYALLEGPRVTGAYRIKLRPGTATEMDVEARVYARTGVATPIATLGLAPLTSMFMGGENQPGPLQALGDFRPEVHDSDGLQIEGGDGEWLWRPLVNPGGAFVTSFAMPRGVRGYGLMQRDRAFASYQDPEAGYERRPGAWVVPRGDWGAGRIELLQFHTPDETNDNVVAYWVPAALPAPGEPLALAYTLRWQGDAQQRPPGAWVTQSRAGRSHETPRPGELQFNVDFTGPALAALKPDAEPEPVVSGGDNARILFSTVSRLPQGTDRRMTIKLQRHDATRPVELRAFLRHGTEVLSETWTYAVPPQ